jgi:hypothetical protein
MKSIRATTYFLFAISNVGFSIKDVSAIGRLKGESNSLFNGKSEQQQLPRQLAPASLPIRSRYTKENVESLAPGLPKKRNCKLSKYLVRENRTHNYNGIHLTLRFGFCD